MLGRRATMRGPAIEKARGRVSFYWLTLLVAVIAWRELTYQKPENDGVVLSVGDVGLAGTDSLQEYGVDLFGATKQKIPWYKLEKWKNVTAGLEGRPLFNLTDPALLQFASILEGMLVPFSRIPGERRGMGSSGMVGARMLHVMGEKPEVLQCAGHVRVVGGQVYFRYGGFAAFAYRLYRFHETVRMLQAAVLRFALQDLRVEFFLNVCDEPLSFLSAIAPRSAGYPFFSMHGATGTTDVIVPDPMDLSPDYLPTSSPKVAWEDKTPKAVFRGPSSNFELSDHNWRASPRFRLHRLSEAHPDLLDARLVRSDGQRQYFIKLIEADGIKLAPELSAQERSAFKYEIVADGGAGTSRTCGVLLSDHAMIRQESSFWQFFDGLLQAGVHFIPAAHHFQDLPQAVRWAQEHDAEVQLMVQRANQLARLACTEEARILYWAVALAKYHYVAMEAPGSVKAPAKLCGGKKQRALQVPFSGYEGGHLACSSPSVAKQQPACSFFCTEGRIPKERWQWLSADSLKAI